MPDNITIDQLTKFGNALSTFNNIDTRNNKNNTCRVDVGNSSSSNNIDTTKNGESSYEMKEIEDVQSKTMENDWECDKCTFKNSFDSEECQICNAPKATLASEIFNGNIKSIVLRLSGTRGHGIDDRSTVWHCIKCGGINLFKSQRCETCNIPKSFVTNMV